MSIIDKKDPFVAVYDNQRRKVVHFRKSIYEKMLIQKQLQGRFFLESDFNERLENMKIINNKFMTTQTPVDNVENESNTSETVVKRTRKTKETEISNEIE